MSGTATTTSSTSTTTSTTSPTKKKSAAKPSHPKYKDMIVAALDSLKERGGSSRQKIAKFIKANYKVGDSCDVHLKIELKRLVENNVLAHTKGTGASGSFKLVKTQDKQAKTPAKRGRKPAAKKATKPVAKKSTPKKSVKKPAKKATKSPPKPAAKRKAPAKKGRPSKK